MGYKKKSGATKEGPQNYGRGYKKTTLQIEWKGTTPGRKVEGSGRNLSRGKPGCVRGAKRFLA